MSDSYDETGDMSRMLDVERGRGPIPAVPAGPKIKVVDFEPRDDVRANVEEMERDLPQLQRYYANQAKLYRSFYDGLRAQEFSPQEALELTKSEFGQ